MRKKSKLAIILRQKFGIFISNATNAIIQSPWAQIQRIMITLLSLVANARKIGVEQAEDTLESLENQASGGFGVRQLASEAWAKSAQDTPDPIKALERGESNKKAAMLAATRLERLQQAQEDKKRDYDLNAAMRKTLRSKKHEFESRGKEAKRKALALELLPADESDREAAAAVRFRAKTTYQESLNKARDRLNSASIFVKKSKKSTKNSALLAAHRALKIHGRHQKSTVKKLKHQEFPPICSKVLLFRLSNEKKRRASAAAQ
eukprot:GABV01001437.1.p1 GENE.GABV01001437.1~~GABV01001437.1.p1  ORF type:complete len:263 (+),score=68.62 GABV01001437.1:55-843(+)